MPLFSWIVEKALNMKLILCFFIQLSGLKINFHKSEIFILGKLRSSRVSIEIFLGVNQDLSL
jgi:hypothetical protein